MVRKTLSKVKNILSNNEKMILLVLKLLSKEFNPLTALDVYICPKP